MIFKRLGIINKDQRGFTLVELMVAIAISALIVGGLTLTIFQLFGGHAQSSGEMTVIRQVQNAGYHISRDAQMAEVIKNADTDDPDTVNGTDVLILYWTEFTVWSLTEEGTDIYSIKHKVTYNLTDDERLLRYHYKNTALVDGQEHTWDYPAIDEFPNQESVTHIAQYITVCDYNQGTNTLAVTAYVGGYKPQSETRTYEIDPRPDTIY